MKKTIYQLAVLAVLILPGCSMHKMMFQEEQSKYDFDKTVTELKASLEKNSWKIIEVMDMKKHYAEYGYETRDIVTYEICKPENAVKIVNEDKYTRMVPFMPMRVAVYKKTDGNTFISCIRIKMMRKCSKGVVKEAMRAGAVDLEKALEPLTL